MEQRRITIFDTTLRDGEQSPGIALQPDEKAEIADAARASRRRRDRGGLRRLLAGDFEGVAAPSRRRSTARPSPRSPARARGHRRRRRGPRRRAPLAHPRLHRDEPAAHGAEAPARAGRGARTRRAGRRATPREHADEVEFSGEDATRSDPAFLAHVCREAIGAGATTSISRTPSATACPTSTPLPPPDPAALPGAARRRRSPSTATTISGSRSRTRSPASRAGATQVECTVNGIGERAGNAALEEVVMALRVRARRPSRPRPASTSARSARRRRSSRG